MRNRSNIPVYGNGRDIHTLLSERVEAIDHFIGQKQVLERNARAMAILKRDLPGIQIGQLATGLLFDLSCL